MIWQVRKRDGRTMPFNMDKITSAIEKALRASGELSEEIQAEASQLDLLNVGSNTIQRRAMEVASGVVGRLESLGLESPDIEQIQDAAEYVLGEMGLQETAKAFILYRAERSRVRELNTRLMRTLHDITFSDAAKSDLKRENANIDGDTAMGTMLKYGSESAKHFYTSIMLKPEHSRAHQEGDIHIHDLDFYSLTMTCCQIDLQKLFKNGFNTGHGHLRAPRDIRSYAALAAIAIQSNQNDQHGGQSIPNFDYAMSDGVRITYRKFYQSNLLKSLSLLTGKDQKDLEQDIKRLHAEMDEVGLRPTLEPNQEFVDAEARELSKIFDPEIVIQAQKFAEKEAYAETDKTTFQAMEAFVHNLNSMHSRAGAQTPFSSINYGMCTEPEARMVIRNLLLTTEEGLGGGETAIFPIQIFRLKSGVNLREGDPNYDLFKLACRVSAKRLFPNFSFQDAPFNLKYYKEGHPETEIAYMGCRTRVIGNEVDPSREITFGRGNLSFTSINLPRIAMKVKGKELFFKELQRILEMVRDQLLERLEVQSRKQVKNFPFLMGQGVWIDSEKLSWESEVREVIKHGTLSIGFIGLAETLVVLTGKHHGESEESQQLGLEIIRFMREFCDSESKRLHLNFSLLATPAEGLSGRFVRMDKKIYGSVPGVTDREYYTNSFHVPVYYKISAFKKIKLEAPYHELTNAGHISYVELDGDPGKNLEAFEKIVLAMNDAGIGYGSINHPVDRDPVCGFVGVIDDVCPRCGRHDGEAIAPERLNELRKLYPSIVKFIGVN
ncbi:MAG: anaerobic ribonucleoside triphosphate reductase [Fibrobacteraceae bacterium]|jgi:ribonucleoside-triphosphate reductase|nr:anaerobic ribonucleoside triphosphate reductase [Fibrobacteraceae bacterium]MBQ5610377.1 anaerobic ribonucleoside triphosphate reductase [Fibrobacteraceae bacterium]MEE1276058.1 anaerobic ribonucleoside triphosphate reductase [Fibrobacteraceae bacterium]